MKILGEGWDAFKRLANIDLSLQQLEKTMDELADEMRDMGRNVTDLRERVARIEAGRENDRLVIETMLERFQLQVERFELRMKHLSLPSGESSKAESSTPDEK